MAKNSISSSPTTPNQLLALTVAGAFLLWGVLIFNGTFEALSLAQQTATLPDGRSLRMVYTGWQSLDFNIRGLVAFIEVLTNKYASPSSWLLFELSVLTRTVSGWVLIESRRRGVRSPWLRQ